MRNSARLSSRAFPGGLASHAAGRVRQRPKAFVPDRSATILANAKSALRDPIARVLGLLALLLEYMLDGLGIRKVALNLREIGSPEALAHKRLSITPESVSNTAEVE
jgi:hypothetical protein